MTAPELTVGAVLLAILAASAIGVALDKRQARIAALAQQCMGTHTVMRTREGHQVFVCARPDGGLGYIQRVD